MRELKFRAWIKDRSEMWYITGFVYDLNKNKVLLYRMNSEMPDGMGSEVFQADNVILQQFTGLKDKSEKDVYEGDIVYVAGLGNCKVTWDVSEWVFVDKYDNRHIFQDVIEDLEKTLKNTQDCPAEYIEAVNDNFEELI